MAASPQFSPVPPSDHIDALLEEVAVRDRVPIHDSGPPEETPDSDASSPAISTPPLPDGPDSSVADVDPWQLAHVVREADDIVEAYVSGHNKGGLLVRWHGLQGFVPASQLVGLARLHVEPERMAQLAARTGELLQLKIIEVQPESNRLIFSERATEVTATAREDLLHELAEGQVRVGVVTNLADFGAFVDLGGVEGLVHISELSWRRLTHPGDSVRPGQKINVLVMDVDARRGRVALSRKKLRRDPWLGVEERYRPGQNVRGRVTNIAEFGVFVLLEEGLEGLLHVSEMDAEAGDIARTQIVRDALVETEVIYVSERKRRLALSLCSVTLPDPDP